MSAGHKILHPGHPEIDDHRSNAANWTMVAIMLVGFVVAIWAVWIWSLPVFIVGCVIIALGAVVYKVMAAKGYAEFKHDH